MSELGYLDKVLRHAEERLVLKSGARPAEILASALQEFVEKGYTATRLEDVSCPRANP